MATRGPTMYQRRMAARRGQTPIQKLQEQYQQQIQALGQERETAYSAYRAETDPVRSEYEKRLQEFSKASTQYSSQAAEYAKGLAAYQKELADYPAFVENKVNYYTEIGGGWLGKTLGTGPKIRYVSGTRQLVDKYLAERGGAMIGGFGGKTGTVKYSMPNPEEKPKFEMQKPVTPVEPEAPEIAEFETEPYTRRAGQLKTRYEREIGERRAGRAAAVSRRRARPLLGG